MKRKDLFEDYTNIPPRVKEILDSYDFDDMDYSDTRKMLDEVNAEGYTFDFYLDNEPFGLRPIDVPLSDIEGYEDEDSEYATGGSIMEKTMREFKQGKLRSSSGEIVTDRKQAIAIGLSKERRAKYSKGGETSDGIPKANVGLLLAGTELMKMREERLKRQQGQRSKWEDKGLDYMRPQYVAPAPQPMPESTSTPQVNNEMFQQIMNKEMYENGGSTKMGESAYLGYQLYRSCKTIEEAKMVADDWKRRFPEWDVIVTLDDSELRPYNVLIKLSNVNMGKRVYEDGGNIGRKVKFKHWSGDIRAGIVLGSAPNGAYDVQYGNGHVLVYPNEIIELHERGGYPTGRAWSKEHYNDNDDEDYETDPSKRHPNHKARNRKFDDGGSVNETDFTLDDFIESKGYQYPREVYFEVNNEFWEVTQALKGEKNVGIFYFVTSFDEPQITKELLDKLISDFGSDWTITLFTNAGVDLHSKHKGQYKNVQIERLPILYKTGGSIFKSFEDFGKWFMGTRRQYPTGRAWSKEHYNDNDDEDYEIDPRQRAKNHKARNRKYETGGELIGDQHKIDMNKNGRIDAEDFKILRSSMNGAWRNEHKHVNHSEDWETKYAKRTNSDRTGYKGRKEYGDGGTVDTHLFDSLKKGDLITIEFDSPIQKNNKRQLKVLSKTLVNKNKPNPVEKITFINTQNPDGARYYAYRRKSGDITMAYSDLAIYNVKVVNEKYELGGEIDLLEDLNLNSNEIAILNALYFSRIDGLEGRIEYYKKGDTRWFDEQVRGDKNREIIKIEEKIKDQKDNLNYLKRNGYPYDLTNKRDAEIFMTDLNNLVKTNQGKFLFGDQQPNADQYYNSYLNLFDKLDQIVENKYGIIEYAKGAKLTGKGSRAKNQYNKEVDAYKWFVVSNDNQIDSGWEYKEDAQDQADELNDGDLQGRTWKVMALITLKKKNIADPRGNWKYKAELGAFILGAGIGAIAGNSIAKSGIKTTAKKTKSGFKNLKAKLESDYKDFRKASSKKKSKKYEVGGSTQYKDLSKMKSDVVNDVLKIPEIELKKTKKIVELDNLPKIQNQNDAVAAFRKIWDNNIMEAQEQAYVLFLNNNNKPIGYYFHSKGGLNMTIMDREIITAMALKCLAKGVIVAHNHPSGNVNPSDADKALAQKLAKSLATVDIALLDFLILTSDDSYSFQSKGDL